MPERDRIGAAILGFYAAIKICVQDGYDADAVYAMLREEFRQPQYGISQEPA